MVQFKTRDDAHWESTLLAHVGGGFALMPSLLAAYAVCPLFPDGVQGRWSGKCRSVSLTRGEEDAEAFRG